MKVINKTIPKGWKAKKIKDLLCFERPDAYIVKNDSYTNKGKTPVLTANKSFILGYTDEDFGIYKNVPVIIFDDFTTDSKYVDFPFKIKSSAIKILRSRSEHPNLKFIFELIKSINFPIGNHKRYYISEFQDIDVAVPPWEEQKKIGEILSSVDEEIQKTDEIISQVEKLKKGLMHDLFINAKGRGWQKKKIEQLCEVKGGKRLPKGENLLDVKTDYPYIRITDFENQSVNIKNIKYLTKEVRDKIKKYTISKNDIYISIAGTIGLIGIIPDILDNANLTENAAKIIIKDKEYLDSKFLMYFLLSNIAQDQIRNLTIKTSQPKLALNKIEKIEILLPSLKEQQKTVEILFSVDEKILNYKQLRNTLIQLKKGLMQDLLSGRVGVE